MAILEARNVSKIYETRGVETPALRGVDLDVEAGEFSALAGPSGSGKTTLLNLIGGLDQPSGGRITIDGDDLGTAGPAALGDFRRRKIGFIFQFFNLFPTLTVAENIAFAAELTGRPVPIADGGEVPLRGEAHLICHIGGRRGTAVTRFEGPPRALMVAGDASHLRRRLVDYLKREARRDIEAAVLTHAARLDVRPTAIRLRDQTSRWGSSPQARE